MRHRITTLRYLFTVIAAIYCILLLMPSNGTCLPQESDGVTSRSQQTEELNQGITVQTVGLEDGVTAVTGKVVINASPKNVWSVITDYDNQKNFVPKLIDSGLISDNGSEQIMFEKGKTGYFLFRKTVYIKLSIRG
jgi:hypothetical protein